MMSYRRPPGQIFAGSPQLMQSLSEALNVP